MFAELHESSFKNVQCLCRPCPTRRSRQVAVPQGSIASTAGDLDPADWTRSNVPDHRMSGLTNRMAPRTSYATRTYPDRGGTTRNRLRTPIR